MRFSRECAFKLELQARVSLRDTKTIGQMWKAGWKGLVLFIVPPLHRTASEFYERDNQIR